MNESTEPDSLDLALALTRSELSPSSGDKARLRTALGLSTSVAAAPRLTPFAALRASGKLGAALGAVLFGAGVATGWGLQSRAPEAAAPPAGERAPAVVLGTAAAVAPAAEPAAAATADVTALAMAETAAEAAAALRPEHAVQHARSHAATLPARSTSKPLDAELALLRRVERALRNADPALALALLAELDERYPQTRLAEERLAARTMAECGLGHSDALAHARAFLREHSASVYSERVHSACASETPANAPAR